MSAQQNIVFSPSPKQKEFLEAAFSGNYKYILFGGAIRGGKTFAALGAALMLAKVYPGSRWAVVRDTLPTLQRNTIPSFIKICPEHFIKRYNQELQLITFTNGSELLFLAENYDTDKELNRFRGLEVNGFILEEANELQEITFYKCIERAGTHIPEKGKKPKPLILLTCNPSQNWVKDKFYNPWKDGTLPEDYLYIPSRITDNPFIAEDQEYMASLKNMPRYQYEVMVNGDWDIQLKQGGEFYKCFELEKHIGNCKYDPAKALHISFDENVNPYLPCGIFQVDGMAIQMIDEIAGKTPNNTVRAVCGEIIRKYKGHAGGMFIYGDATSRKEDTKQERGYNFFSLILDCLQEFKPQLRINRSNPSVVMRGNFINTILEKDIYDISILINEHCKNTIGDFVNVKEAPDGTKAKTMATDSNTKVRYQQWGHFTDLTDYFICYAFATQFAQYQRGGRPFNITVGYNVRKFQMDGPSKARRTQYGY